MKKFSLLYSCLLAFIMMTASCTTISVDFEEGANPEMYFQRAQIASDRNDFELAQRIYYKLLETGITDPFYVVSAKYEIAFLNYKLGKREEAIQNFEEILKTYYEDPAWEGRVPQWPQVLSKRLLQKLKPAEGATPPSP